MTVAEDVCLRAAVCYQRHSTRANLERLVEDAETLLHEWWRVRVSGPAWAEEEGVQAGRLKLWEVAPRWAADGEASFLRFIKMHVVGAMKNAAKALRQKHLSIERDLVDVAVSDDVGSEAHVSSLSAEKLLAGLPDTLRIICRMRHVEGYTVQEIAAIGGFTHTAVEQLLAQASLCLIQNGLGKIE